VGGGVAVGAEVAGGGRGAHRWGGGGHLGVDGPPARQIPAGTG
jgi:hypothetical protein